MRRARALAFLTLTVVLSACAGSRDPLHAARTARASRAGGQPGPNAFLVKPSIIDPLCNGGRGIRLSSPLRLDNEGNETTSTGTIPGGLTVISYTSFSPSHNFAALVSVTPNCALDRQFGSDGTASVTVPSSLRPARGITDYLGGLELYVVAARSGGGAIVAGSYEGAWVVGEVTGRGQLDPTFGNGGWSVLPFEGGVTALRQEPSGRIIIGANEHSSGCCTVTWAAALSAHGQLERGFGRHGRVKLPTGEDSNVSTVALEPDGDILVDVSGGNMGCWYTRLAMLTPSGQSVPQFATKMARFWQTLGLNAFVGGVHIEGEGFTLIGTGQKPCYEDPPGSTPPATGLIARFRPGGEPASPTIRFPSRMYGAVQALTYGGDTFILASRYSERTGPTITALRPNGSLDPRFGHLGRVQIHPPRTEGSTQIGASVSMREARPGEITLIAGLPERPELQLIRLRL
jgi:hypothetical protein